MKAVVLEVVAMSELVLAVVQLVSGDVTTGMIVSDSIARWRVTGVSTTSPDAWKQGRRGVALQPLDGARLAVGAELVALAPPRGLE